MKRTILLFVALQLTAAQFASAGVPPLMNYSATLKDGVGTPQVGTFSVTFSIYSTSSGGSPIWTETQSVTTDSEGLFNVLLGSILPLTHTVFSGPDRFLGTTVSPDPEMVPRTRIASVAYAFRPATVDGATGGQISGTVTTAEIAEGLRIQGPGLGNANEAYLRFTDQAGVSTGYVGDAHPGNGDVYLLSSTGGLRLWTVAGEALTAGVNGNVGIGAAPVDSIQMVVHTLRDVAIYGESMRIGQSCGVAGVANHTIGFGVYGKSNSGLAGRFDGNVDVNGTLSKDAGSFKIDHPIDPSFTTPASMSAASWS